MSADIELKAPENAASFDRMSSKAVRWFWNWAWRFWSWTSGWRSAFKIVWMIALLSMPL